MSKSFPIASSIAYLISGNTLTYNPLIMTIENNSFELNLRGAHCSVIQLDGTPFFALHGNMMEANGDVIVAGLAQSLS